MNFSSILAGLMLLLAGMLSLHLYARHKDREVRHRWRIHSAHNQFNSENE